MDDILLATEEIAKSFPGVRALDGVCFSCRRGEVHALVGENGAGKTTLMRILAGSCRPDSGAISFKGSGIQFDNPREAQEMGIGTVYQEPNLLPYLSVAENIFLGREPANRWGLIDAQTMTREAEQFLARLGSSIDVRLLVYRLSIAERQMVEIAKALSIKADLIIMDEPSSALTGDELEGLFSVIRSLKEQGITVIYVSHRLEEIFRIADRVTVLKDGQCMGTLEVNETDEGQLIRMMVGRPLKDTFPERGRGDGDEVLSVRGLSREGVLWDINLVLKAGEIVGVAGLVGSGRTELVRALFGADPIDGGEIMLRGERVHISNPEQAMKLGLGLVSEDRKADGLILPLSVRANVALPSLRARQRLGFIQLRKENEVVSKLVADLNIRTPSLGQPVWCLSGGNQQKVVLAKWLATKAELIIFDEPTRGIDVGAKVEIYHLMRDLANEGKAILMISSELPEILGMSDRVIVLSGGRLMGEISATEATEEKILALAYSGQSQRKLESRMAAATPENKTADLAKSSAWWIRRQIARGRAMARTIAANPRWAVTGIYSLLVALLAVAFATSPSFRSAQNLQNIGRQAAVVGMLSIGQTFVVLAGGIDVSVSGIITLVAILSAEFMAGSTAMILPVLLGCVALGTLVGIANGLAVIKLSVQPFIATLGMMSICRGIALTYTKVPVGRIAREFQRLVYGRIGPLPSVSIFLLILFIGAFFVLRRLRFGRYVYATGGGREIARLAGINVNRIKLATYIISGITGALTGLYIASRMGVGDPVVGPGLEWDSITAVVIGGTTLAGGRGGIMGTLAGVLIIAVIANMLNQLNIGNWYQEIVKGFTILAAVMVYRQSK
jgi:ABC-type sugar transport system ATPase subunit/ribose/xylose/arabinose/galactoside ABC-type transport system permease subunit